MSARRDEGFLLLDARHGREPGAGAAGSARGALARVSGGGEVRARAVRVLFGCARSSRCRRKATRRRDRIREHLEGMRSASHRLHDWVSCELPGRRWLVRNRKVTGRPSPAAWRRLLKEAGWEYHERPGGALLADLETGSQFLQAEIGTLRRGRAVPRDAVSRRRGRRTLRNRRCASTCWRPTPRCGTPGPFCSGTATASRPASRCAWKAGLRRRRRAMRWRRFRWRAGNAPGKWKS